MYCTAKSLTVIYIDGHDNIPDIALLPSSLIKKYDQETSNKDLGSQQTVVSVNKLDLLMNYEFGHCTLQTPDNYTADNAATYFQGVTYI
jgi:hypothetical protein